MPKGEPVNDIEKLYWIARSLDNYSEQELIRLKWAAEGLAQAIKDERQSRDARVVDEVCNLDIPVNT
jgi:hypothetical protein